MALPVSIKNKKIYKQYQISATTSATTARLLVFPQTQNSNYLPGQAQELILAAEGAAITFLFGNNSSISANTTATADSLPQGNFTLLSGAIYSVDVLATDIYVSVKTATGSGTAYIQIISDLT